MIQYHIACPDCGSSDGLTDYGDHTFCFVCHKYTKKDVMEELTEKEVFTEKEAVFEPASNLVPIKKDKIVGLKERGITKSTAEFYGVWFNDSKDEYVFPFFSQDCKKHVANQFRTRTTKGFMVQGDWNKTALFGQQLFPAGSAKQITITEGAIDALSAFEMVGGGRFPCVAVKSAGSARKEIADNFEYLNSFDKIVICFDKDEEHKAPDGTVTFPGQEAAQKVAQMFPLGKVRLLTLAKAKDANDYLTKGWQEEFSKEWWGAPNWSPVGLKNANDMWEELIKENDQESVPYPFEGLNKLTYGIRTSEFVTITAMPGVGKTSVVQEITYQILQKLLEKKDNATGVGLMMLESSNKETLYGLMSLVANKPLHLPDVKEQVSKEEMRKYFDAVYGSEKVIIWDHFGSNSIHQVLDYVRYMAALGCKYIVLDHLSIIVSDQSGDERKGLDEISTKLKTLCMELNVGLIAVIHQNRKGEIRGTMGVEQLSNIVIKLYRDTKNDDEAIRNTTKVTVEKNRFSGRTGPACLLFYDATTGRLAEQSEEALHEYIEKDSDKKVNIEETW